MENKKEEHKKADYEFYLQIAIIAILAILLVYNLGKITGNGNKLATGLGTVSALDVLPKGTPAVYGTELGISYNDISASNLQSTEATISKLASYENMQLDNATMARYVRIGSSIACEYCCGATTLVFSNGQRACGCAHSYAMRGLAKYLLTKHPEMTDLEILIELGKWKVLFFPGPEQTKAGALKANGIDYTNYVNLASNLYRGIENQAPTGSASRGAGQVGGC